MEKIVYSDIANFIPGVNLSRIAPEESGEEYRFYTAQLHQEDDWQPVVPISDKEQVVVSTQNLKVTCANDVVINLANAKAVIVKEAHAGRVMGNNFVRVELDVSRVSPLFWIWHFNESKAVAQQKLFHLQGSTIPKLSLQMVRQFEMDLPALKKQQEIGGLYLHLRMKSYYQYRLIELKQQSYLTQIENILKQSMDKNR